MATHHSRRGSIAIIKYLWLKQKRRLKQSALIYTLQYIISHSSYYLEYIYTPYEKLLFHLIKFLQPPDGSRTSTVCWQIHSLRLESMWYYKQPSICNLITTQTSTQRVHFVICPVYTGEIRLPELKPVRHCLHSNLKKKSAVHVLFLKRNKSKCCCVTFLWCNICDMKCSKFITEVVSIDAVIQTASPNYFLNIFFLSLHVFIFWAADQPFHSDENRHAIVEECIYHLTVWSMFTFNPIFLPFVLQVNDDRCTWRYPQTLYTYHSVLCFVNFIYYS